MSARALLVVFVVACGAPPPPPAPEAPPAPELVGGGREPVPLARSWWTLEGRAEGVAVRVYLDERCVGPVLLTASPAELAAGLRVDLVYGSRNVFAARAVSAQGVSSACSLPVRLDAVRPLTPTLSQLATAPQSPSRERRFVVTALVEHAVVVRVFASRACAGPRLDEVAPESLSSPGYAVEVPENGLEERGFIALNSEGYGSGCQGVLLVNDTFPPTVEARLLSPRPSLQAAAWVSLGLTEGSGTVFGGPGCSGGVLRACGGAACTAVEVQWPSRDAGVRAWSVRGWDPAGNESPCVDGQDWLVEEPPQLLAEPPVELGVVNQRVYARIPALRQWVQLFATGDCSGPTYSVQQPNVMLWYGAELPFPADGGVLSGRAVGLDGGLDPCSLPTPIP